MIIDFHTHVFPDQKSSMILTSLSKRADIPHFTDGTLSGLLNSMEKGGIHLSVISRITTRADQVMSINQWLYGLKKKNILPLATIHPDLKKGEEYIEKLKNIGFKGIKVHPDYQGFYADDKRMYPFYDALQSSGMPILFHAGLDRGLLPPFHAMPEQLLNVHRQFPRLKMVAAHMGGEDNYQETEECLLGTEIYLDTAFVLRIMDKNLLKRFLNKHSKDRFLFGSDSPFSEQAEDLKYLMNLSYLNQQEKEKIAGKNAADLLGV
jgi:predicted TIM-barrel fold metal-dependent hydrolase